MSQFPASRLLEVADLSDTRRVAASTPSLLRHWRQANQLDESTCCHLDRTPLKRTPFVLRSFVSNNEGSFADHAMACTCFMTRQTRTTMRYPLWARHTRNRPRKWFCKCSILRGLQ